MRAQASLEYLVVSAVALSLLSISVIALSEIKSSAAADAELMRFRSSAVSLSNAINEVCALGHGNGRELSVSRLAVEAIYTGEGFLLRFSGADASIVRKSPCDVDAGSLEGHVYISNENGLVKIRAQ